MISVADLSAIMKNAKIVAKIYLTNFPRDNEKRTRTPYSEYIVCACPSSFQIQNGGYVIRMYGGEVLRMFHDY